MNQPKFYRTDNKVIAVSTYAGKTVRGVAKCNPEDTFSIEHGQALAAARCNEKIAAKRLSRAMRKVAEAKAALDVAQDYYDRMRKYFEDSAANLHTAQVYVNDVIDYIAP